MADELPEPKSRKESYLAKAAGMDVTIPEKPESRLEQYLDAIAEGGGGGGGGTSDFNDLNNRPKYNGTAMTGETDIPIAPTVVQTTGTSQTDVMSQNAVTSMIFRDPSTTQLVQIGKNANAGSYTSNSGRIAIGNGATSTGHRNNIAIGNMVSVTSTQGQSIGIGSGTTHNKTVNIGGTSYPLDGDRNTLIGIDATVDAHYRENCVCIGYGATASRSGEMNIGSGTSNYGYNNTPYRVIGGVHDGQDAHDAVTVEQVNATIDAINTALSTSIPHIGAAS